jgi:hypothetical protein
MPREDDGPSELEAKQRLGNHSLGAAKVHALGLRHLPQVSTAQRLARVMGLTSS